MANVEEIEMIIRKMHAFINQTDRGISDILDLMYDYMEKEKEEEEKKKEEKKDRYFINPSSSWVESISYFPDESVLVLKTKSGKKYEYKKVPVIIWNRLAKNHFHGGSTGEFYNKNIKGKYKLIDRSTEIIYTNSSSWIYSFEYSNTHKTLTMCTINGVCYKYKNVDLPTWAELKYHMECNCSAGNYYNKYIKNFYERTDNE